MLARVFARRIHSTTVTSNVGGSFAEVAKDLSERLYRSHLNAEQRRLVYRKRGERVLQTSRKTFTDKEGNELEPRQWPGIPSSSALTNCIARMESHEDFETVKKFMKDFVQHYPSHIRQVHFIRLIRQATTLGLFNEAYVFVKSGRFDAFLNDDKKVNALEFQREVLRSHVARLTAFMTEASPSPKNYNRLNRLQSLTESLDNSSLDVSLLKLTGLTTLGHPSANQQLEHTIKIIDNTNAEEYVKSIPKSLVVPLMMDLQMGLQALRGNASADGAVTKVEAIAKGLEDRFPTATDRAQKLLEALRNGAHEESQRLPTEAKDTDAEQS